MRFEALLFAVAASAACTPTVLSVADYETGCSTNSECVIVSLGDQCAACPFDFAAVNDSALAKNAEDREAATAACAPWSERFHVDCVFRQPDTRPVCDEGACVIPTSGREECTFDDSGLCRGESAS